jgi:hypothetical protein
MMFENVSPDYRVSRVLFQNPTGTSNATQADSNCISLQKDVYKCKICKVGYFLFKYYNDLGQVQGTVCKSTCGDGYYPKLVWGGNDESRLNLLDQSCAKCHSSCLACLGGPNEDQCTVCTLGKYLNISNNEALTGRCIDKVYEDYNL